MNQCPNATSFRNRVPILYQWEKQSDCQNKLWEAILVNGETRFAVNSISKGEKVVILYQFCVTVGRMLCSWIRFSFIFQTNCIGGEMHGKLQSKRFNHRHRRRFKCITELEIGTADNYGYRR